MLLLAMFLHPGSGLLPQFVGFLLVAPLIGDGGIDFVVSAAAGLISASAGNYEFLAGPGRIG